MVLPDHSNSERPKISEDAAHRLLARAVELDAHRATNVSISQLRDVAREAGISSRAFEDALAEALSDIPPERSLASRRVGLNDDAGKPMSARALFNRVRSTFGYLSPGGARRWRDQLAIDTTVLIGAWFAIPAASRVVSALTHGSHLVLGVQVVLSLTGVAISIRLRSRVAATLLGAASAAQIVGYSAIALEQQGPLAATPHGWLILTLVGLCGIALGRLIASESERPIDPRDRQSIAVADGVSHLESKATREPSRRASLRLRSV